jgi:radical SAM protein with 4Fe4S-binding SPASM domain
MKEKLDFITLEVTSQCNLNCRYCYNIWKIPETKGFHHFNSYHKAKKTLKRLFKIAEISHVTFTGGEPFLAERFPELVLYARMKKKSVTIITNGSGTDETGLQQMIDLGVSLFELPIHSYDPKIHDYLSETEGSWQNSVRAIKFLKSKGANAVAVIVITKANYEHIDKTLEFIDTLGIKRVMLNRFNIGGRGISERENLELDKEQLNHSFRIASETGRTHQLSLSSNVCTPFCILNPRDYANIRFGTCSTDVKKRPLTVDINGDLRFCNHSPTVLGNIYKDKLNGMFASEKALSWNVIVPDYCNSCELYTKCLAGCRAASEQLKQSLDQPDPILLSTIL